MSKLQKTLLGVLLPLVHLSVWAGQAVITIVEPPVAPGKPSWVEVCLSNWYHKVTPKGFTGIVLTRESSTNAFLVLRSMAVAANTLELEAVNAISGITIYLERLDIKSLDNQKMSAILHSLEGTGTASKGISEAVTASISEWSGGSEVQKNLSFAFRQAIVQNNGIHLRGQKELLNHVLTMQDLVSAKSLPVSFSVTGKMLPACYCLKPEPIPAESLAYYIVDASSAKVVGNITIASPKDIPAAINRRFKVYPGIFNG